MILDIPYAYQAEVRRPRKRNADKAQYRDVMPVEIREASATEAPVALTFPDPEKTFEGKGPMDVRVLDGQLYKPYQPSIYSGEPHTHRDVAWLKKVTGDLLSNGNPLFHGVDWLAKEARFPLREDPQVAEVRSSDEEAVKAAIVAKAKDLLVVDGMVWRTCEEPVLRVTTDRYEGKFSTWASVEFRERDRGSDRTFNLREADWVRETNAGIRVAVGVVEMPDLTVHMPEVLRYPASRIAYVEASKALLHAMKDRVVDRDVAYFEAYALLRDTIPGFDVGPDALADVEMQPLFDAIDAAAKAETSRLGDEAMGRNGDLARLEGLRERMAAEMNSDDDVLATFGR